MMWSEADAGEALNALGKVFADAPRRFFTEHDLHSRLYRIVEDKLTERGLFANSKDGMRVGLVHHEYPTPFRCDMGKHEFRIVGETEKTASGGLFKRGRYDLVVLNPEFVKDFDAIIVAGKSYARLRPLLKDFQATPLLWVCEILFANHTEVASLTNWFDLIRQDALKIIESLRFKVDPESTSQSKDLSWFS